MSNNENIMAPRPKPAPHAALRQRAEAFCQALIHMKSQQIHAKDSVRKKLANTHLLDDLRSVQERAQLRAVDDLPHCTQNNRSSERVLIQAPKRGCQEPQLAAFCTNSDWLPSSFCTSCQLTTCGILMAYRLQHYKSHQTGECERTCVTRL